MHHERFDRAVAAAREWFSHAATGDAGAIHQPTTVLDACNAYVKRIQELKGSKPAQDLAARYRRWITQDPIHKIELMKLTRDQMNDFRRRMVAKPITINKAGEVRERSKDSVNRDIAAVRAALNCAFADGKVNSNFSWSETLKAFKNVAKRGIYIWIASSGETSSDMRQTISRHSCGDCPCCHFARGSCCSHCGGF
ncbi:hypothetical protein [Janthinobacterium lividum]|uniref:hypothetical protein n=1 Tax=Janthinobacterium lividum TaxID=29581 RepID=UPI00140B6EE6|nr:hypothetical protein [Janthinobacterium lividum]NHQ90527.1 hypothetical protein [Janthinobacterium lividum]